jgi:hypothetical protein
MPEYLIYFNQQWVGEHPAEWFAGRGPLARDTVQEIRDAGHLVFAGGLEEGAPVFHADATSGSLKVSDGPYVETTEFLGGLTIVDVPDEKTALVWAGKIAEACGWPQEVRLFGTGPDPAKR